MLIPNVPSIPLCPRPAYRKMIVAGSPEAFGRIVGMSDDRRTAYVVWRGTVGTYRFQPDPATMDTCYVIQGRAIVRRPNEADAVLTPGALFQFPREPFEMQIVEEFVKTSFLYNPNGLSCEVEPL